MSRFSLQSLEETLLPLGRTTAITSRRLHLMPARSSYPAAQSCSRNDRQRLSQTKRTSFCTMAGQSNSTTKVKLESLLARVDSRFLKRMLQITSGDIQLSTTSALE